MQFYSKSLSAVIAASMLAGSLPGFAKTPDNSGVKTPSATVAKIVYNPLDPKQMSPIQMQFTEYLDGKMGLVDFGTLLFAGGTGEGLVKNVIQLRLLAKARALSNVPTDLTKIRMLDETVTSVLISRRQNTQTLEKVTYYGLITGFAVIGGRAGKLGGFDTATGKVNETVMSTLRKGSQISSVVAQKTVQAYEVATRVAGEGSSAVNETISAGSRAISNRIDIFRNGSKQADTLFLEKLRPVYPDLTRVVLHNGAELPAFSAEPWVESGTRGLQYRVVDANVDGAVHPNTIQLRVTVGGSTDIPVANGGGSVEKFIIQGERINGADTSHSVLVRYIRQQKSYVSELEQIFNAAGDQVISIVSQTGQILAEIPVQASEFLGPIGQKLGQKAVDARAEQMIIGAVIGGAAGGASAFALDRIFIEDPYEVPAIRDSLSKEIKGLNMDSELPPIKH